MISAKLRTSLPAAIKNIKSRRILVTGSVGQIGSELIPYFRKFYGHENVIASDIKQRMDIQFTGPFVYADVQNYDMIARIVLEYQVDTIIHLASLLSAIGEKNPLLAMKVNARGIENVMEVAKNNNLSVYAPSSIAAFGPSTPKINTPQETLMRPTTVYGVTKVYTELIGEYYHKKFGVDFRSIRYPGIVSSEAMAGGGTTDYAVEIFHYAVANKKYSCFLNKDTEMPMMYMPDTLKATLQLIEAPEKCLTQRCYNVTGMSFTPGQIFNSIKKIVPNFNMDFKPDFRQKIAETWPKSIDDSRAKKDWGWEPDYNIDSMSEHMINRLREKKAIVE